MQKSKLAHSTLIYFVLGFLPLASSLLLTPIYTQYLSPSEYGVIALAGVLQTYLSLVVCFGLDAAFSRFYFSNHENSNLTSNLLSTVLLTILSFTIAAALILYFTGDFLIQVVFKEPLFTYSTFGIQVLLTSGFGICYNIASQYYRDSENIRSFTIISIVYFLLLTGCTFYGVVIAKQGAAGSINGKMIGTVISMLLFLVISFSKTGFSFDTSLLRSMLKYSYPLFIYGLMAAAFDTMDRFFIVHYFDDMAVLGQYNFAFVIASVIGIVIASYQSAVNPPIYKMMLDRTSDHSIRLNELMKRFIWTGILFSAACITLAYALIIFFINPAYHDSLRFIPFLALSFIPRAYYIVWSYPLFTENKTRVLPVINGISIIAGIIANMILIPVMGVQGIAVAVIIIKSVQACGAWFFSRKLNILDKKIFDLREVYLSSLLFLFFVIAATRLPYTSAYYPVLMVITILATGSLFMINNRKLLKALF